LTCDTVPHVLAISPGPANAFMSMRTCAGMVKLPRCTFGTVDTTATVLPRAALRSSPCSTKSILACTPKTIPCGTDRKFSVNCICRTPKLRFASAVVSFCSQIPLENPRKIMPASASTNGRIKLGMCRAWCRPARSNMLGM
jgi:hypothetical protein